MKKLIIAVRRLIRSAGVLALALAATTAAFSQDSHSARKHAIDFENVLDTTQGFTSIGQFPAINDHGEVAFHGVRTGFGEGVFRARVQGDKIVNIATSQDGLNAFGDDPAINAGGVVAFTAITLTNSHAVLKGDGGSRTVIADSAVNGLSRIGVGAPSINAAGTVAFFSQLAQRGLPSSVFTGNGGPLTTVATTTSAGFTSFRNAAINDAGTVVFSAGVSDGSSGIFTASGATVDIVDTNTHPEIDNFEDPVINNAGTIADVAFLLPFDAPEVITANTRGITPRNDPSHPLLTNSEHPSLNNSGAVAFFAFPSNPGDGGQTGIFLEVSGGQSLIPVIQPGDPLFGSTVVKLELGRFALNNRFQLAFSYTLADGRSGVAIASYNGEQE